MKNLGDFGKTMFLLAISITGLTIESLNAATITSVASGDWSSTSSWVGGVVPGSADSVVIASNHTITVSDNRTAGAINVRCSSFGTQAILTVDELGDLTISRSLSITSTGSSRESRVNVLGAINITSNIIFSSTNSANARITMIDGGELSLSGSINNISQGIILSDELEVSDFIFSGSASQTIPVHSNVTYHNLVVNKSGANAATLQAAITGTTVLGNVVVREGRFSNGGFSITGNSGKSFIVETGGTFIVSGTSSLPSTYTHDFQSGSTVEYSTTSTRNIEVPNAGSYHNLLLSGNSTKSLSANTDVNGSLTISAGTLDASASNYNIIIGGNWNNAGGSFTARNGTVTFDGASSQSITSNAQSFYNVTFNNTASGSSAITLSDNVTVSNACTMTDGIISTGSNRLILSSTNAANLSGFSSACYVNGNLRRNIASNTSTYAFPVGSGTLYRRADVKNNNLTGVTYIDASFGSLARHNNNDMSVNDGAGQEYINMFNAMWTIDPDNAPSGGTYDIYLFTSGISGLTDNDFAALKRPTGSPNASSWTTGGGTINAANGDGRKVSDGYALRMGLSSFSEFGIGTTQSSSSLPIVLVNFDAVMNNNEVKLSWATATEINNDYFTVERSKDGVLFEPVLLVEGAGNSTQVISYEAIDEKPLEGVSYYRLKQTDFDGQFDYSSIVSVNNIKTTNNTYTVFPNPAVKGEKINIIASNSSPEIKTVVEVFNVAKGEKVAQQEMIEEILPISLPYNLSSGIYLINITNGNKVQQQKIIVQ